MTTTRDLLIEIGSEELPPKALKTLIKAFAEGITGGLQQAGLSYQETALFGTPRRLAIIVFGLSDKQPDKEQVRRGPALTAAFDAAGNPTKATLGFAASCGTTVERLEKLETEKGSWLVFQAKENGRPTVELIPDIVNRALNSLPIPKRMRWGANTAEFVRPVHWLVLLFGTEIIPAEILGIRSGRETRGHRFHHPEPITISEPNQYEDLLQHPGKIMPCFAMRRRFIQQQVEAEAAKLKGQAVIDRALLDEVTALVEWPVILSGNFEERFLEIPAEVLISTMKDQQRYFHVVDSDGRLLPHFITVSNIDSRNPDTVRRGNERVVKPRLTDAAFFWDQDRRIPLASRLPELKNMIFQKQLGTLYDKSVRIATLAQTIAQQLHGEQTYAERAGQLAKADLLTALVGEFPDLQGMMGHYYAIHDGEPAEVAAAIEEHYLPRYAGDHLPQTKTGQALAIADRLDTLVGIFGIGQPPSGDKDPFALRRAALGVLRIIIEGALPLDLEQLLTTTVNNYGTQFDAGKIVPTVFAFMMERLRAYYLDTGITPDVFEAVLARQPKQPYDFGQRLQAVIGFKQLEAAASLAAANKRIRNILKQAKIEASPAVNTALLAEPTEQNLHRALLELREHIQPLLGKRDYVGVLTQLSSLKPSVDSFFDKVMVMTDDQALRTNRLALLGLLQAMFLEIADIALLQS